MAGQSKTPEKNQTPAMFEGRTVFGHCLNNEIANVRGSQPVTKKRPESLGPQEKDFGLLSRRCKILSKHVASFRDISQIYGLCAALDNLNDFLDFFIARGDVDPKYKDQSFLEEHYFYHDVSRLDMLRC